jgi:hypothetical protein
MIGSALRLALATGSARCSQPAFAASYAIFIPSEPIIVEQSSTIHSITVGQQVIVMTTILSNADDTRAFVAIIEVRDANGITEEFAWQTGQLTAKDSTEIGISWIPEKAGT